VYLGDIEKYLEFLQAQLEFLQTQLAFFGVKYKESDKAKVIESIRKRMYSLISHWNDEAFRKGILITGLEEAVFYDPPIGTDDARAFVVLTIRNSLIEDFIIDIGYIKKVTTEAIKFFSRVDFRRLCDEAEGDTADFYAVAENYPAAWRALRELASDFTGEKKYSPVVAPRYEIKGKQRVPVTTEGVTQSGIDPEISNELYSVLCNVAEDKNGYFYSDCFKAVSRHFEKLLRVMEFILSRNKIFVTANYAIANGYLKKRSPLLRPASDPGETMKKEASIFRKR
jgi:hypothetical protein